MPRQWGRALRIPPQPFREGVGVQFEQVVVVIVEVDRAAFARDAGPPLAHVETEFADAGEAGVVAVFRNTEGDVVVAARGEWLAFHDRDPERGRRVWIAGRSARQEEPLARQ